MEKVSVEWLHSELRSSLRKLIILDCRSSTEFSGEFNYYYIHLYDMDKFIHIYIFSN